MMSPSISTRHLLYRATCRSFCLALAASVSSLMSPSPVAADIIYNIVPIGKDAFLTQYKFSLDAGYIAINQNVLGPVAAADITDWSVTFNSPRVAPGAVEVFRKGTGSATTVSGKLYTNEVGLWLGNTANTPDTLTLEWVPPNGGNGYGNGFDGYVVWTETALTDPSAEVSILVDNPFPAFTDYWNGYADFTQVGDWLIATREVPEPSSILLSTLGLVVGGSYGIVRRKRRVAPSPR